MNSVFRNIVLNTLVNNKVTIKKIEAQATKNNKKTNEKCDNIQLNNKQDSLTAQKAKATLNRITKDALSFIVPTIFARVQASELTIEEGVIRYGKSYLKSVRIHKADRSILEKIDHEFCLVHDNLRNSKMNNCIDSNSKAFRFDPANDLSFLLAEIERLSALNNCSIIPRSLFPDSGQFEIPWDFVTFYDGIMYLIHPNSSKRGTYQPFHFRHYSLLHTFNDLKPYIEKHCSRFQVEAHDGVIISIFNFKNFERIIPQLRERVSSVSDNIEVKEAIWPIGKSFTINEFSKFIRKSKSPFLSTLSKHQLSNRKIYYLLELVSHESNESDIEEHGYLFTIKESDGYSILIYENVTDESRSSIVFKVCTKNFELAIQEISEFLGGPIKNKRQKLVWRQISFNRNIIISINRIVHNDYYSWASQLRLF